MNILEKKVQEIYGRPKLTKSLVFIGRRDLHGAGVFNVLTIWYSRMFFFFLLIELLNLAVIIIGLDCRGPRPNF